MKHNIYILLHACSATVRLVHSWADHRTRLAFVKHRFTFYYTCVKHKFTFYYTCVQPQCDVSILGRVLTDAFAKKTLLQKSREFS